MPKILHLNRETKYLSPYSNIYQKRCNVIRFILSGNCVTLLHLVGYILEYYYDARTHEHKICHLFFLYPAVPLVLAFNHKNYYVIFLWHLYTVSRNKCYTPRTVCTDTCDVTICRQKQRQTEEPFSTDSVQFSFPCVNQTQIVSKYNTY